MRGGCALGTARLQLAQAVLLETLRRFQRIAVPAVARLVLSVTRPRIDDEKGLHPLGMDGGGFVPAQATAPFGSETRAILGELGFSSAEVDALLAEGVTRDRLKPRG